MEEREKRAKGKAPQAVNLSDKLLSAAGETDDELQRLIHEQTADSEPSPLEESCKRVRARKQV